VIGGFGMCVKDKLNNVVDWIKISVYIMGFVATAIICLSTIITIPEKINNHEKRLLVVEKDVNEIKIETVSKLISLQEDVRIIKEALIKNK
jgi:hypothetical protein